MLVLFLGVLFRLMCGEEPGFVISNLLRTKTFVILDKNVASTAQGLGSMTECNPHCVPELPVVICSKTAALSATEK